MIRPNALGFGLDTATNGAVLNADGKNRFTASRLPSLVLLYRSLQFKRNFTSIECLLTGEPVLTFLQIDAREDSQVKPTS